MKPRKPDFDFSNTPARWTKNGEFAHQYNAPSTAIPHLERFLNRVMIKARAEIKGDDPESVALREQISIFIKQEANHYTAHTAFNEAIQRAGYPRLKEFEEEAIAHYRRLLETKSLAFLCAYCEGFETFGPLGAIAWLDQLDEMLEGGDPAAVGLWKWHLMEEYEHRTVCHDVFMRIHGGYFLRLYGFFYQAFFLFRFSARVRAYLLEEDRKSMTEAERQISRRNEKDAARVSRKRGFRQLLRAFLPTYTPYESPEPKNYRQHMAVVEAHLSPQ